MQKFFKLLPVLSICIGFSGAIKGKEYNCASSRPEMAGSHNMVLFGDPADQIYTYHLPLFSGKVNGEQGHVLMHVYQGLWQVSLDKKTKAAYEKKFKKESTFEMPYPFFSVSPRGKRFKVPEMFCSENFELQALSVYGHVEGNPNFPEPELLLNNLSTIKVVGKPLFAKRFDGKSKEQLTYLLFGTSEQMYLAHYLTDDENSFDQILAVSVDQKLRGTFEQEKEHDVILLTVPQEGNKLMNLESKAAKANNALAIPHDKMGQTFHVHYQGKKYSLKTAGLIYFNKNSDLHIE